MKINAGLIKASRAELAWSQEELAIAAGLNLRTVQRIENEAVASLQSKKALAGALNLDVHDLDAEEQTVRTRYEDKTLEIDPKDGFLTGIKRAELPDFTGILNSEGREGWKLIQFLTPDTAQTLLLGKTGRFVALLMREYIE